MAGKKCKGKKGLLIFVSVVAAISVVIAGVNSMMVSSLIEKGNSYKKLEFENQLVPEKVEIVA